MLILCGKMRACLVSSTSLSFVFSSDDFSSSEGAGEKTELNEDDSIKSQEVRIGFHTYSLRMTSKCVLCLHMSSSS